MSGLGDVSAAAPRTSTPRVWSFAGCVLDERSLELKVQNQIADLDRKPLEVLIHLLRHAGEVVTKDELAEAVWPGRIITDSNLTKTMAVLRAALGDGEATVIKTVHGYGYRLMAPVSVQAHANEPAPARFDFKPGESPPLRPHWQLSERLGAGSHGEVWLAHHSKTKEPRVFKFAEGGGALTALKREITLNRLLRETLPGRDDYLRLLDWNFDEPPFFVESEYAASGSLAAWAEAQGGYSKIPLATRLDLLAQAAEALAAAHSVGVLHKDLKPTNILVVDSPPPEGGGRGRGDVVPRIKLADFGSGGVLDSGALEALGITAMGFTQKVSADDTTSGTPLYLAPEVLAGQPFTVQSDIYALGVMLYQLVAGDTHKSLAPGWEKDVADELLREDIAQTAAGNPADRLSDATLLAQRLRSLVQRRRTLEEARRSTAQLQQAKRDAAEQSRKAELVIERSRARRRWMQATVGVLVAGTATATMLYLQARQARVEAERAVAISEAVNDFLNKDLLGRGDPTAGATKDLTIKDILTRAAKSVDQRLGQQPAAAARVHDTLGNVYFEQGDVTAARLQWERAAELQAQLHGPASVEHARALLRVPDAWIMTSSIDEGCRLADQLLSQLKAANGPPVDLLRARYAQAQCLRFRMKNAASVPIYREVKLDLEQMQIPDDRLYVATLIGLAFALTPDSEPVQRELLDYLGRTGRAHDTLASDTRTFLGISLMSQKRFDEADREMSRALADQKAWVGEAEALASSTASWTALLRLEQGRFEEAATLAAGFLGSPLNRDVTSAEKWYALLVLAESRLQLGDLKAAVANARAALDLIRSRGIPEDSIPAYWARAVEADGLRAQGRLMDAARVLPPLPEELRVRLMSGPKVLRAHGLLERARGHEQAAAGLLAQALDLSRQLDGEQSWRTKRLEQELAQARKG